MHKDRATGRAKTPALAGPGGERPQWYPDRQVGGGRAFSFSNYKYPLNVVRLLRGQTGVVAPVRAKNGDPRAAEDLSTEFDKHKRLTGCGADCFRKTQFQVLEWSGDLEPR